MNGTEAETAWAAGLFEGEGCISIHPNRAGGVLILRMCDEDVLTRFASIVGCGRIRGPLAGSKPNHKPSYEWRAAVWRQIVEVLAAFDPWLGDRRKAKAAQLLTQPVTSRRKATDAYCRNNHPLSGPRSRVRMEGRKGNSRVCIPCQLEAQRKRREQRREAVA